MSVVSDIDTAISLAQEIQDVRYAQRELVAAFARLELDGGPKAAKEHPLYLRLEARINELHEQMTYLI